MFLILATEERVHFQRAPRETVSLPLCLQKVSCHISVYAATCYIALVGGVPLSASLTFP